MSKYLKIFDSVEDQTEFRNSVNYLEPHVSCLDGGESLKYNKVQPRVVVDYIISSSEVNRNDIALCNVDSANPPFISIEIDGELLDELPESYNWQFNTRGIHRVIYYYPSSYYGPGSIINRYGPYYDVVNMEFYGFEEIVQVGGYIDQLSSIKLSNELTTIGEMFYILNATNTENVLKSITFPKNLESISSIGAAPYITRIKCLSKEAPYINNNTLLYDDSAVSTDYLSGTLYYPKGSDYSSWLAKLPSGWVGVKF